MLGECAKTQEKSISLLNHEFFRVIKEIYIVNIDINKLTKYALTSKRQKMAKLSRKIGKRCSKFYRARLKGSSQVW